MFRLSDGEEIMTLAFFVLIQYRSVTDRQPDIPPLAIPAVCIARYANALVKMHQIRFRLGAAPDPAGGAHSAPPDALAGFKVSYF